MNKKADMSINTIVAAALALIVLVILIFIFKDQIGNLAGGFFSIGNDAKGGASGTKCKAMFTDRACAGTIPSGWEPVQPPISIPKPCKVYNDPKDQSKGCKTEGWSDCPGECIEITKKATT